jgi:thiamine-phosphate pyrophosphorylase
MPDVEAIAGVYALADDDPRWRLGPLELVEAALDGGARAVQLRLKHTRDRDALELARAAVRLSRRVGALLIVNDRYDLADLAGADGVHLGQDDVPPEHVPAELRSRLLIGLSTHTLEQLEESRTRPIDYVAFGPVFVTKSKDSEYEPRGVELLARAVERAAHPLVAIGGIGPDEIRSVAEAGAAAAAVISAITASDDPEGETHRLGARFRGES